MLIAEVLSDAKKKQLLDICSMSLSSIKVPHVSQRRDGDTRFAREINMFVLFCLDEHSNIYWMIFRDMWLREQIVCLQSECVREIYQCF